MKKIALTLFVCSVAAAHGQTVTPTVMASQGGSGTAAQGSLAWTIGEPVSGTFSSASNITTVGFHQPEMDLATLLRDAGAAGGIAVFPNPVRDAVDISFTGMPTGAYQLELLDAAGRLIYRGNTEVKGDAHRYSLSMSGYAGGAYLLNILSAGSSKTIKLNKVTE